MGVPCNTLGGKMIACCGLVGKARRIEISRKTWTYVEGCKMNLREIEWGGMDLIHLA
jgi:hypothetical protein